MTPDAHGLLIGKFYPPHAGHHALVRAAAAGCERLTVLVMASFAETVPLEERVHWLRCEHASEHNVQVVGVRCDAPLDVTDDAVWSAQVAVMRAGVRQVTATPITAVWSAEGYGSELARRLGATHRRMSRVENGLSGTTVRADLAGSWWRLAPGTRAGLATRVVVVGAESTGTTTTAQALASHYRRRGGVWASTACVGEYGREFTEVVWSRQIAAARARGAQPPALDEVIWTVADFDEVAREQTDREQSAAAGGSPLLVCDTDALATTVWERRYLGSAARTGQSWAAPPELPRHHLYLVTDHENVPWTDDGLREGDLAIRTEMTGWFIDALTAAGHSWVMLTGTPAQRLRLAVRTVDQLLAHRSTFGQPLHGPGFETADTATAVVGSEAQQ